MGTARNGTDRSHGDPLLDAALAETGWLRALARSLVEDTQRAEDAVQASLTRALERRPERRSLRAWLAAVLRNELRQDERARGRRTFHEQRAARTDMAPSAAAVNERLELQRLLLEAVRALEEPTRATLVARFFDNLPPRAIARRDGVPVKTVDTRLARGLALLRARLDAEFGGQRGAWLRALAPFAGAPGPWGWITEGASMGTKAKGIAAVVAVGIGLLWVAERVRAPEPRSADSAARAQASGAFRQLPGGAVPEPALRAPAEAGEIQREARPATTDSSGAARDARDAASAQATLELRVVKRHSGAALAQAELVVSAAAPGSGGAAALLGGENAPLGTAQADATGRARLDVPAARALWLAVEPGSPEDLGDGRVERVQRTTVPVEPLAAGETRTLVIELEHGSDRLLEGQVVAAEDGRALAGARVLPAESFGQEFPTDAQGAFALPYSSWDPPPHVRIECDGFTGALLRPQWLDLAPGSPVRVALERPARIAARIDAAQGAELVLVARSPRETFAAELDEAGRAVLAVPARTELEVGLRAPDGALLWLDLAPWTLAPGEERELALALTNGTLVYGWLTDADGAPLADTQLWALPSEGDGDRHAEYSYLDSAQSPRALDARSGPDGRYEFAALAPGAWWLGPAPLGGERAPGEEPAPLAPAARRIELAPGMPALRVDLVAWRGLWIRGRVEGEEGHGLARVLVECEREHGSDELRTLTDDAGVFQVGPLAPGTHHLRTLGGDGVFGWPSESTTAEAGATDVRLVLHARHSIGGLVLDAEGRALDAHVHLLRRGDSLGQGTSSREPGAFLFVALEPGSYSLQAEAPDGRVAVRGVELAPGGRVTGAELRVQEGTRIGVRHDLEHDARCAIWAGDVLAADSTVRRGEEGFETVPAGPLRIELYSGDEILAVRELVGRAGRVESVDFDLRPGD